MGPHAEAAQRAISNATKRHQWTREHPGDVIRRAAADVHHSGAWWECLRNGKQIAEADNLGLLLDVLERAFR